MGELRPIAWDPWHDDDEGETFASMTWRPSRKAFARYLKREVELARVNVRIGGRANTLHSFQTVVAATETS